MKLAVLVAVLSIAILYYFILFAASALLIRGTRKRDHTKLMPFMILMCVGIVIYILQIITSGAGGIVIAILMLIVCVLWFVFTYSLYAKLRDDKMSPPMQPYSQPVVYAAPYQAQTGYSQQPATGIYPATSQSTSADQPKPSAPV